MYINSYCSDSESASDDDQDSVQDNVSHDVVQTEEKTSISSDDKNSSNCFQDLTMNSPAKDTIEPVSNIPSKCE